MILLQRLILAIMLVISSSAFSQAKGKEYGVLEKGKAVEISHRRNSDNSIDFLYRKSQPGSYTVYYSFSNVRNTSFSDGVKKVVVKHNSGTLFKLRPNDSKKGIRYKSSYNVQRGITDPKINEDFVYMLPFPKDASVKLLNGKKTDSLAIEITEKTDKVFYKLQTKNAKALAARKGVVIEIKSKLDKKTRITIEHNDGTYCNYYGFSSPSIKVKEGDKVLPGMYLGDLEKDKDGLYTLNFRVTYKTKKDGETTRGYVTPFFATAKGNKILEREKTYSVSFNEEIFFQEFSKKEKKKYIKAQAAQ